MYETKLAGVYILLATSVCVRCGYWPFDEYDGDSDDYRGVDDVRAWNCDTENKNTLAEIKSEIQNLQQLVVGLRQKLDPDFKFPPTPESKCPPGFQYVDRASSCYKVVYELHSWTAAGQTCNDLHPGAHLAVITNNDENLGLIAYLQPELAKNSRRVGSRFRRWFSGGTLLWTSGQRLNETSCTDEFVWKLANSTQLPLSFTYWDREEPNCFQNEIEGCLQLKSYREFRWNDGPCEDAVFPLCECRYWRQIWPLDDNDGGSGEYRLNVRYNHNVPALNCDTEHKNALTEIKSEIQNLQQLLVGLRRKLDPDCMEVMPLASVHSQQMLVPPSGISASSAKSKCPPGFQYVDRAHSCYKVIYEEHRWAAAGRRCRGLHPEAHLAVITSSEENIGLIDYLQPEISKNPWRGSRILWTSGQRLNETSCTDEFVWKLASGTQLPLSFTYWDRNEPNCHNIEGCLQMRSFFDFKWNDDSCDAGVLPLCEYDPL